MKTSHKINIEKLFNNIESITPIPKNCIIAGQQLFQLIDSMQMSSSLALDTVNSLRIYIPEDVYLHKNIEVPKINWQSTISERKEGTDNLHIEKIYDSKKDYALAIVNHSPTLHIKKVGQLGVSDVFGVVFKSGDSLDTNYFNMSLSYFAHTLISTFDLNCTQCALIISDSKPVEIVITVAFERFIKNRELLVESLNSPTETLFNLHDTVNQVANTYCNFKNEAEIIRVALIIKNEVNNSVEYFDDKIHKDKFLKIDEISELFDLIQIEQYNKRKLISQKFSLKPLDNTGNDFFKLGEFLSLKHSIASIAKIYRNYKYLSKINRQKLELIKINSPILYVMSLLNGPIFYKGINMAWINRIVGLSDKNDSFQQLLLKLNTFEQIITAYKVFTCLKKEKGWNGDDQWDYDVNSDNKLIKMKCSIEQHIIDTTLNDEHFREPSFRKIKIGLFSIEELLSIKSVHQTGVDLKNCLRENYSKIQAKYYPLILIKLGNNKRYWFVAETMYCPDLKIHYINDLKGFENRSVPQFYYFFLRLYLKLFHYKKNNHTSKVMLSNELYDLNFDLDDDIPF